MRTRSLTAKALACAVLVGSLVAPVAAGADPIPGTNCHVFPESNIWNTPVDTLPVLPNSASMVSTIGANIGFHADFGAGTWNGGPIGIPFITVPGTQPTYPAAFLYAS